MVAILERGWGFWGVELDSLAVLYVVRRLEIGSPVKALRLVAHGNFSV